MLLTVRQAAGLLRTTERQVYRWVDAGQLPFRHVGEQIRFNRTELLEWATSRHQTISLTPFVDPDDPDAPALSVARALARGGVHHLDVSTRERALAELVARLPLSASCDREFITEVLRARPSGGFTHLGDGLAIPHVKQPLVAPGAPAALTVSHLSQPIALALGSPPAEVALMLVSPTVRTHLLLMARLSRTLADAGFRAALLAGATRDELVRAAERVEAVSSIPPRPSAAHEAS